MKWILSHASDDIHHWQLQTTNSSKSLIVNLQRLSLRLSGLSKRLFFLDVQGFLNKKIILRTEYGVALGETAFNDKPSLGLVTINDRKFSYGVNENKLQLFDNEKQVISTCELSNETKTSKLEFFSLLFGLLWFSTADAVAEKQFSATA